MHKISQRIRRTNFVLLPVEFKQNSVRRLISSTNSPQPETKQQVNSVELIGNIHKRLFTKSSGLKSLIVRTKEPENKFYYHMIGTYTPLKFEAEQRVHIVGKISSQNHWTEEKKLRQKIIIKADEFELLPNHDMQSDKNHLILFSQIYSDIKNTRDCSTFTMTTQHKIKGGVSAGIYVAENHRIVVREPSLLEFVRAHLKRLDWVRVEGKICYTFTRNSQDQLRTSGYILAHSITKETLNSL